MADASCSGSTPFKRLVDHQQRDVSHHQDRLVNQSLPGAPGSFRSATTPSQTQNDFSAFMDGSNAMSGMPHDPAGRLAAHAAALDPIQAPRMGSPGFMHQSQQSRHATPDFSNWASDFNNHFQQPQQRAPLAPLQNEVRPTQHPLAQQQPQYQGFQSAFGSVAPLYGPTNGGFMDPVAAATQRPAAEADFDQEMSRWMAANGSGDMTHVDAAMDQMAQELELNEATLRQAEQEAEREFQQEAQIAQVAHQQQQQDHDNAHLTDLETPEIANLSLDEIRAAAQESTSQEVSKERSAVAEAAEQLLDSVQHEQGEKWQNSVFLSLMRDFRDGRKDIVGSEILDTDPSPSPVYSEGGTLVTDFRKLHRRT
ncbi:hypothetical protein LIA77_09662 [Sarocladium implicatum]|nr:hypothetical protein LIA77_09662 [Sarocladium implicatum]